MTQNKNENILRIIKSREFRFGKKRGGGRDPNRPCCRMASSQIRIIEVKDTVVKDPSALSFIKGERSW